MGTIDWDRMQAVWPAQVHALRQAVNLPASNHEEEAARLRAVEDVCLDAVAEWDEIGTWPDDWALFERDLMYVQHWRKTEDLASMVRRRRREVREACEAEAAAERARFEAAYPEHIRQEKVLPQSQAVGEFLEWLEEHGYEIGEWSGSERLERVNRPIQSWLAQYFQIDPAKIEAEKRAMIEALREGRAS